MQEAEKKQRGKASPVRVKGHGKVSPEKILDLWWLGCGGTLKSPRIACTVRGTEPGVDYPYLVSLHMERFFAVLPADWRELAWWATENAYRLEHFPVWRATNERILAMGMGALLMTPKTMRGRLLFRHLKTLLLDWVTKHPLPEATGWIEYDE